MHFLIIFFSQILNQLGGLFIIFDQIHSIEKFIYSAKPTGVKQAGFDRIPVHMTISGASVQWFPRSFTAWLKGRDCQQHMGDVSAAAAYRCSASTRTSMETTSTSTAAWSSLRSTTTGVTLGPTATSTAADSDTWWETLCSRWTWRTSRSRCKNRI